MKKLFSLMQAFLLVAALPLYAYLEMNHSQTPVSGSSPESGEIAKMVSLPEGAVTAQVSKSKKKSIAPSFTLPEDKALSAGQPVKPEAPAEQFSMEEPVSVFPPLASLAIDQPLTSGLEDGLDPEEKKQLGELVRLIKEELIRELSCKDGKKCILMKLNDEGKIVEVKL